MNVTALVLQYTPRDTSLDAVEIHALCLNTQPITLHDVVEELNALADAGRVERVDAKEGATRYRRLAAVTP